MIDGKREAADALRIERANASAANLAELGRKKVSCRFVQSLVSGNIDMCTVIGGQYLCL